MPGFIVIIPFDFISTEYCLYFVYDIIIDKKILLLELPGMSIQNFYNLYVLCWKMIVKIYNCFFEDLREDLKLFLVDMMSRRGTTSNQC